MAKGGGASRPRFRLLPTVLLTAAILALPTVVYGWGRSSSSFAIDKVVVTGVKLVPERRVLRLLRRDYLGHNLFTVTTKDVHASLASLCYISDAGVDRDFPGTLRVSVAEYRPAVYALAGGRWYVIADDGHVICEEKLAHSAGAVASAETTSSSAVRAGGEATATVGAPDAADGLPVPTGKAARRLAALQAGPPRAKLRLPRLAVDERVVAGTTLASESLRAALPVVAGLPHSLREALAVMEVTREGQITLRFDAGPAVVWGLAGRTLAKSLALKAVLDRYEQASQKCVFVDVSTPDRVLARPVLK
jgi:cell division septal protein FtsQ